MIARERARCAELRAEAQAIAREAELADRRLAGHRRRTRGLARAPATSARRRSPRSASAPTRPTQSAPSSTTRRQIFAEQRRDLIGEIETADAERRAAADRLAEAETELAEADKAARAALEALGEARAEAAARRGAPRSARRRLADIAHEIHEILRSSRPRSPDSPRSSPTRRCPTIAEVEGKLERIRHERERLGAVNLRAEEELREVEEQHTKLTAERDDLIEAIKRLRQGIHSLNHEARERLLASFEVVNEQFQESVHRAVRRRQRRTAAHRVR